MENDHESPIMRRMIESYVSRKVDSPSNYYLQGSKITWVQISTGKRPHSVCFFVEYERWGKFFTYT